jgi:hypothetical protein
VFGMYGTIPAPQFASCMLHEYSSQASHPCETAIVPRILVAGAIVWLWWCGR